MLCSDERVSVLYSHPQSPSLSSPVVLSLEDWSCVSLIHVLQLSLKQSSDAYNSLKKEKETMIVVHVVCLSYFFNSEGKEWSLLAFGGH